MAIRSGAVTYSRVSSRELSLAIWCESSSGFGGSAPVGGSGQNNQMSWCAVKLYPAPICTPKTIPLDSHLVMLTLSLSGPKRSLLGRVNSFLFHDVETRTTFLPQKAKTFPII